MFAIIDTDGDGEVDVAEFTWFILNMKRQHWRHEHIVESAEERHAAHRARGTLGFDVAELGGTLGGALGGALHRGVHAFVPPIRRKDPGRRGAGAGEGEREGEGGSEGEGERDRDSEIEMKGPTSEDGGKSETDLELAPPPPLPRFPDSQGHNAQEEEGRGVEQRIFARVQAVEVATEGLDAGAEASWLCDGGPLSC